MMNWGLVLMGSDPRALKLQSAWIPLQRQEPRHSVRLTSFFQALSPAPLGSRCCCQDSWLGLAEARSVRSTRRLAMLGCEAVQFLGSSYGRSWFLGLIAKDNHSWNETVAGCVGIFHSFQKFTLCKDHLIWDWNIMVYLWNIKQYLCE